MSNMGVLSNLEPKSVFCFFEEICGIPHGSENLDQISNYLAKFAKDRGLKYIQDEAKNIIIFKDATKGYENSEPVIIQGHMDMVAVARPESGIDMKTTPLNLQVDGDMIYAKDTSLGGDDGIAVAYALAILDSDTIPHPPLEVIITVNEEIGMNGAAVIDLSTLKGKRLINLDSEDEGIFLVGCAGGARVDVFLPVERQKKEGSILKVKVIGLLGGHSGGEIDKERGNADCMIGRILYDIKEEEPCVIEAAGGVADNVICSSAEVVFTVTADKKQAVLNKINKLEADLKVEFSTKDPNLAFVVEEITDGRYNNVLPLTKEASLQMTRMMYAMPNGIQAMSADISGLVQTSCNFGMLKTEEKQVQITISVRSSIKSEKYVLIEKIKDIAALAGATTSIRGDYPGWAYRKDSPLRDTMLAIFEEMYNKKPVVEAIHAGLECGIFNEKIPGLDCVSLGPDMKAIHSYDEKLSISSSKRVWEYVLEVLKRLK